MTLDEWACFIAVLPANEGFAYARLRVFRSEESLAKEI